VHSASGAASRGIYSSRGTYGAAVARGAAHVNKDNVVNTGSDDKDKKRNGDIRVEQKPGAELEGTQEGSELDVNRSDNADSSVSSSESDTQGKAEINFSYDSDGLERFQEALEKYDVTGLFENVLPEGQYTINIVLDGGVEAMQTASGSEIRVNPNYLSSRGLNIIGSSIGHELVHVNDFVRGNVRLNSSGRVDVHQSRPSPSYRMGLIEKIGQYR